MHKDQDKYYLFFHASPHTGPYRMGVAVATSPLGPFTMSPHNPILTEGKNGSWNDYWVASGNPLRRKAGDWIMLFSARCGGEFGKEECDGGGIGLATAPTPEGPWVQHPTPVINRAQGGVPVYVASVIFARGQYHLYCENETAADMGKLTTILLASGLHPCKRPAVSLRAGTLAHWTAAEPEGPWTLSPIPALLPGETGAWDAAGFSESRVNYVDGVFHLFYQKHCAEPVPGQAIKGIVYGHVASRDLVKWTRLPVAIWNDQWYDSNAIFSGSATLVDGVVTIVYPGLCNQQLTCEADGGGWNAPDAEHPQPWCNISTSQCVDGRNLVSAVPADPTDPLM
eukprot:COSAG04_NODE_5550_length_1573_cov_1.126866_2_plen_340_part_00